MSDSKKTIDTSLGAIPWFIPKKDFDPLGTGPAMQKLSTSLLTHPWLPVKKSIKSGLEHGKNLFRIIRNPKKNAPEIIGIDSRFASEEWTDQRRFALLALTYLSWRKGIMELVEEVPNVDEHTRGKAKFITEQIVDMLSPSNNPFLNPEVLKVARETKGMNFIRGMNNFLDDLRKGSPTPLHSPEGAFVVGGNIANTKGSVIARNHLCEIIHYTPTTEKVQSTPILLIPPWINKFYILDMGEEKSYIQHLLEHGHQVFCISWKNPTAEMSQTTFDDYVTHGALFARGVIEDISGCAHPSAIGYCLGGTLTMVAQAYAKGAGKPHFSSITLFATMVDFCDAGDVRLFIDERSIAHIEESMKHKGYLDGNEMTSTFAYLRSKDLLWSFVINNYYLGNDPKPFDILAWNADSTRMPAAMHGWYLRNMYLYNKLKDPNALSIHGVPLNLKSITEDIYIVGAEIDHIAPAETVFQIHKHTNAQTRYVLCSGGHLAGIINPLKKNKGYYFIHTPQQAPCSISFSAWKEGASKQIGSWWADHKEWLSTRTGAKIEAPTELGSSSYPATDNAPGKYVFEQ